jgi:hypothetical protein
MASLRFLLWLVLSSLFAKSIEGQVVWTSFPKNLQFLPRNISTNQAILKIAGDNQYPISLTLLRYQDDLIQKSWQFPASSAFQLQDTLGASLNYYHYRLYLGPNLILQADSLVVGDVFLFNGQSNAEAKAVDRLALDCLSPFIRTYGNGSELSSPDEWFVAHDRGNRFQDGFIGQLALSFGSQMIHHYQRPVCILNGAEGGEEIEHFLPGAQNVAHANNFFRLQKRLEQSGLLQNIRSLIWFQGEQDALNGLSGNTYSDYLNQLFQAYQEYYPALRKLYLFQIRAGCNTPLHQIAAIQQAQLDFDLQQDSVFLISSNYTEHDGCHFYLSAYRELARRLKRTLCYQEGLDLNTNRKQDLLPDQILLMGDSSLLLSFPDDAGIEFASDFFGEDFYIPWYQWKPIQVSVQQNQCLLSFGRKITQARSLSYTGHPGNALPALFDSSGNTLLCFHEMPIKYALPFNEQASIDRNVFKLWKVISPVEDVLRISYSGNQEYFQLQMRVYNSQGMQVKKITQTLQANMEILVSDLAPGI